MSTKSTERVNKLRAARKASGQVRRDYSATPEEHNKIKAFLDKLRDNSKK